MSSYLSYTNGSLIYHDDVANKRSMCDPNIMFLLGLDAMLNEELSSSNIVLPKSLAIKDNILSCFEVDEHLSQTETSIIIECSGIKQLVRSLSGTGSDRIVPILYRSSEKAKHFTSITEQMEYLHHIFECAGVETNTISGCKFVGYLMHIGDTQLYKLIAYQVMYSYALGVLYGCKHLGFIDESIWQEDPQDWYDGELANLVSTAYEVFSFKNHCIPRIDRDPVLFAKYKGTPINKIWNFSESLITTE